MDWNENTMAARFDDAAARLGSLGHVSVSLPANVKARAQEIRLRAGRPASVSLPQEDVFLSGMGTACRSLPENALCVGHAALMEVFRLLCESSVYTHQQEIRNGFLVLRGGHRAGICGTAVVEDGQVHNLRDISSINLRVAREIPGAGVAALGAVSPEGVPQGALLVGPPGCGKTTVLRDLARLLSSGQGITRRARVAVVDERGEIAACHGGVPQNDLGPCCDVLDGYPKGEGILQAVRSLSPDVVVCDEIGSQEDAGAVLAALNAGVVVIATAHAGSLDELRARPQMRELLASGAFVRAVILRSRAEPGVVRSVEELLVTA